MLRRAALAAVCLVALPFAAASADPVGDRVAGVTRVAQQAGAAASAQCRREHLLSDEQCDEIPLSPQVSQAKIEAYLKSETHRDLAFQQALGDSLPLRHAAWIGTHNSFNNSDQSPTVSELDANQQLSMTDQLNIDVRSLELDAHWFPSVEGGGYAAVLCHGEDESEAHAGCTTERLLVDGLTEISTWLTKHPHEVVLLYVEDHLVSDAGYAAGAKAITTALGSKVYSTHKASCTALPLDLTRNQVRAAGKQVVIMSTCHAGAGWNGAIFDDNERARNEVGPEAYGPGCDPSRAPTALDRGHPFDDSIVRVYEDSTAVTALTSPPAHRISPAQATVIQHCAVDLTGFDQLLPDDGRLAAMVWTWASGQPATGSCAVEGTDSRWRTGSCATKALACKSANGWFVGIGSCPGGAWSVPRYGWEATELQAALKRAHVSAARLDLHHSGAGWT